MPYPIWGECYDYNQRNHNADKDVNKCFGCFHLSFLIFPFVKIFISDSQARSKQKVSFVASMLADAAPQSLTD